MKNKMILKFIYLQKYKEDSHRYSWIKLIYIPKYFTDDSVGIAIQR